QGTPGRRHRAGGDLGRGKGAASGGQRVERGRASKSDGAYPASGAPERQGPHLEFYSAPARYSSISLTIALNRALLTTWHSTVGARRHNAMGRPAALACTS